MNKYEIEFIGHVYVTIPVAADSFEEACALAEETPLPRRLVVVEPAPGMPTGTEVAVTKDWEINRYGTDDES